MECKVRTKLDVNIQNSTLRFARNSTSASPTIQHSTFNTQHCAQRTTQHSTLRTARNSTSASPTIQHSTLKTQHSNPHPTDGTRRAILRWGTLDSMIYMIVIEK